MPPIFMDIFLEGFNADDTSKIVDTSNSSIIIFVGSLIAGKNCRKVKLQMNNKFFMYYSNSGERLEILDYFSSDYFY